MDEKELTVIRQSFQHQRITGQIIEIKSEQEPHVAVEDFQRISGNDVLKGLSLTKHEP